MSAKQWGRIFDLKGHPSGYNDVPAPIASLPFLAPKSCHLVAFSGAYTPLKRLVDVTAHMVFIRLRGSHELFVSQAVDVQCYLASTGGDSREILQALFTRASLRFQEGTRRSFAVLISILHPSFVIRALRRLALGTRPRRVLQSIHLIRPRHISYTCNFDTSLPNLQAMPTAFDSSLVMKLSALNVQHTVTN